MDRFRQTLTQIYEQDLQPMLRDWLDWLAKFRDPLLLILDMLATWFLAFGRGRAWLRWLTISLLGMLMWVGLAVQPVEKLGSAINPQQAFDQVVYVACQVREAVSSTPAGEAGGHFCDSYTAPGAVSFEPLIFEIPLLWLFSAGVFRHILLIAFTGWLAFKFAARYQAEIYELQDVACAEHFILQAALINPYNVINIREGNDRPDEEDMPGFRVGGPGKVTVHLENAALFEKVDGTPRVIGPTVRRQVTLDGFERLRRAIDLRDQKEVFDIRGRSQDGVRVTAKDVSVVYSVYRAHQEASYERPYPFQDPQAIENLVYHQGLDLWNVSVGSQIRGALLDFFAQHPLNEFLAMIQEPELKERQEQEMELIQESQRLAGSDDPVSPPPLERVEGIEYVSRPQLTDLFYTRAEESALARGVQIDWVGVGTWDFLAQQILARHQEAWRITHDNLMKNSPAAFNGLRWQHKINETLRLIQMVPIGTFKRVMNIPDIQIDDAIRALILAYYTQMREAHAEYERSEYELEKQEGQETDPVKLMALRERRAKLRVEKARVAEVMAFLSRFTGRWLTAQSATGPGSSGPMQKGTPASEPGMEA